MKIIPEPARDKVEKLVRLKKVEPGEIVRFQGVTYEEAVAQKDENTFYMVVRPAKEVTGRKRLISIDGMHELECEESHLVHHHTGSFVVSLPDFE